jgi:hypothetical protein
MKDAVFWDLKIPSYLTGNTLLLLYRDQQAFSAVTMKNFVSGM